MRRKPGARDAKDGRGAGVARRDPPLRDVPGRAPPAFDPAAAERAALAAWVALVALAAARAALAAAPSTWGWSLALQRFMAPVPGWGLWALAAAALVPALAQRALPWASSLGDALARRPGVAAAAWAAGGAVLAWMLPDRIGFVGDFQLRENTLSTPGIDIAEWYPQALPLDLAIHHHLARTFMLATGADAALAGRVIGALDAAILGGLAARFPRALGLSGAAALVAAAGLFWTGSLTLFTGYSKAFAEMALLVVAVGVFGARAARDGRGLVPLLLAAAAGITLHRSALGVLPAVALACAWAFRTRGRELVKQPATWFALAAPVVALAFMVPRIVHIVRSVDPIHFTPAAAGQSALAAAFAGARPADLANLVLMLAPLAPSGVVALVLLARAAIARREFALFGALAFPFVALMPLIHAQQGLFRDWDDFAAAGMGVALLSAWLLAAIVQSAGRRAWVAAPLVLCASVASLQWVAHHTDAERALRRVRAFVAEPPSRTGFERAMTWQYLGVTYLARNRPREAADAYAEAASLLSSPHILRQWGLAESMARRHDRARGVFRTLLERVPGDVIALRGLMLTSLPLHDSAQARAAAESLLRVSPGDPQAAEVLRQIERGFEDAPPR